MSKFGWRPQQGSTGQKSGELIKSLGELKNLRGMFTVQSSFGIRLANYEELRSIELHKIDVERQRAQVSVSIQRRIYQ